MTDYMKTALNTKSQERLLELIEFKVKEVDGMVECNEKLIEKDMLDVLIHYQSILSEEHNYVKDRFNEL